MRAGELREAMRKRFEAMSLREWCRLTGCKSSHVSEFVSGKRAPPTDLLRALNLEIRYVRRKAPNFASELSDHFAKPLTSNKEGTHD